MSTRSGKLKIVVFTIKDSIFVPPLLEHLMAHEEIELQAVYISSTLFSLKRLRKRLYFFLSNTYPFCIKIPDYIKLARKILHYAFFGKPLLGKKSLKAWIESKGFRVYGLPTLVSSDLHQELKAYDADAFLFCIFDKLAKQDFIDIPRFGIYNLHLGKLPSYKGGFSSFWVLRNGDTHAGASIHQVNTGIDEGNLVAEMEFPYKQIQCMI